MAIVINMPRLSDTMTEGVVAKWHANVGDTVKEGMLLAEIETDKATMDFEAFPGQEGVLLHIGIGEGQTAPVDSLLCVLGAAGEDISALLQGGAPAAPAAAPVAAPAAAPVAAPAVIPVAAPAAVPVAVPAPAVSAPVAAPAPGAGSGRVVASPLAKRMAEEKGIDLRAVAGSGDGGRIVKRDVDSFVPETSAAVATSIFAGAEGYVDTPNTQMRKTIARRLSESKFTAPHFYLKVTVDMSAAMAARVQLNAVADAKVSFNDLVVKAAALSLKKHPAINSAWMGDFIRTYHHVHVGVAVAVEDGLLVPVVRHADAKSLQAIGAEVKSFAQKAKDKKLQPSDWEGNTFTISNLGMFGIDEFTAIINSPDACILAVGGIQEVPVVKNGQVVPGQTMKLTLSCDHRAVDGATGAAFLQTLKQYLEAPVTMLL
jgi:pyruvate dehydrogenase E2 component (dihydrolipoamide acetyltransferase)